MFNCACCVCVCLGVYFFACVALRLRVCGRVCDCVGGFASSSGLVRFFVLPLEIPQDYVVVDAAREDPVGDPDHAISG